MFLRHSASLTHYSIAFCVVLVLGTVGIVSTVLIQQNYVDSLQRVSEHALVYARAIRDNAEPAVLLNEPKTLERVTQAAASDEAIQHVQIIGLHGNILAAYNRTQSPALSGQMDMQHPMGPHVRRDSAVVRREGTQLLVIVPIWRKYVQMDLGIMDATEDDKEAKSTDGLLGYLCLDYSLAQVTSELVTRLGYSSLVSVLVVMLGVCATVLAVRQLIWPIKDLVQASSLIAEGDLTKRAAENAVAEVGLLARSFNHMAGRLQESYRSIERKVEERTAELRQAVERANELAHAAEAASRTKSEFLANMSHELRTPLNGVVGMTELLIASGLDARQQSYADTAKKSADALLSLINDILDFSKIEAGKLELEHADFRLWSIVEDVTGILAHKAQQKGLEMACFIDPSIPEVVCGDPKRLEQILMNLANNAIKFTEKGEVVIRVAPVAETATDVALRFTIRDSGVGISPEQRKNLFLKFSQVDASTTRKYGGTGLGLAISKQLVELMRGQIDVESELGKGSTFWFTVQLDKSTRSKSTRRKSRAQPEQLHGLRVLAVDDNPTNREILCQQVSGWGLQVQAACNGREALAMLRQATDTGSAYRIGIIDMQMPDMDGMELAETIHADPRLQDTLLIMLSSVADLPDAERIRSAGFHAYLTKPVKQSQLLETILEVVAGVPGNVFQAGQGTQAGAYAAVPRVDRDAVRILLAEDNDTNQQVALGILAMAGFSCDLVTDGKQAVRAVQTKPYDIVLMDCQMPEMDGFEATRRIRQAEQQQSQAGRLHKVHIIALTANAITGDRERCMGAGMDDYVSKPIDPAKLVRAIESHISGLTPSEEAAADGRAAGTFAADTTPQKATVRQTAEPQTPAPATATTATPILDLTTLVHRCLDNPQLAQRILRKFQETIHSLMAQIEQAVGACDTQQAGRHAHTLKGAAANISAEALRAAAALLEQQCKAGAEAAARTSLLSVQLELERCLGHLPQALQQLAAPVQ